MGKKVLFPRGQTASGHGSEPRAGKRVTKDDDNQKEKEEEEEEEEWRTREIWLVFPTTQFRSLPLALLRQVKD